MKRLIPQIIIMILAAVMLASCGGARVVPTHGKQLPNAAQDANALLLWLSAIAISGFGACVAAAVFLPVKRMAIAGATGFAAMLALALTTKAALPYLPWVALALGLIGLGAGIWYFRKYALGMSDAVAFGCAMEKAETDQDVSRIKADHSADQIRNGTKSVIDAALEKIA